MLDDIRYGARMALKNPGFALVVVLVLGLCIGANTVIFSVVNTTLLRPLPYQEADRLLRVWAADVSHGYPKSRMSPPDISDLQQQSETLEGVAAFFDLTATMAAGDEPVHVRVEAVSASFFSLLGTQPALGRLFLPDEEEQGKNQVVVLSHGTWQRRFNSDPNSLGRSLTLNGRPYTIIGVLPADFRSIIPGLEGEPDVWRPLSVLIGPRSRSIHYLMVIGKLKPGVSLERARSEASSIAANLEQQYPESNTGFGITLESLQQAGVGDKKLALLVLLGAVLFVLLIACGNVANLLLARAALRQKEMAIRTALGASRARLVRLMLTENAILALAGGVLGLVLAAVGMKGILAFSPPDIPRMNEVSIDLWVLAFTLGVTLLTVVVFGLAPALQGSRVFLSEALKEGGRTSGSSGGTRGFRSLLVISEVGLTLVLLIGAGLLLKSFGQLLKVNPGFATDNTLTMQLSLPSLAYPEPATVSNFYKNVVQRIESLPGVEVAAAVDFLPLSRPPSCNSFTIEGRPPVPTGSEPCSEMRTVTTDYFRAMRIPLLAGRVFSDRDNDPAPRVVVINNTMRDLFWSAEDPLGRFITIADAKYQIVGVVGDTKNFGLDSDVTPELFWPMQQEPVSDMTLVVRSASDAKTIADMVQREVHAIDSGLPIYNVKSMDAYLSTSVSPRRFNLLLLGLFAGAALILAAVGIYGLISYSVSHRTHEIGLRMALGATQTQVLKLVLVEGMLLTGVGLALGLVGAFVATSLLASLLFQVSVTDVATFIVASAMLAGVALLASLVPALRATRVDPMVALRQQ